MSNSFYDSNRRYLDELQKKWPDERRRDDAKIDAMNRELAANSIPEDEE